MIDWIPFTIFVGLLPYFVPKIGASGDELKRYREECLKERRKLAADAERIAEALEKHQQNISQG